VSYDVLRIVSDVKGSPHTHQQYTRGYDAPDTVLNLNPKYCDINYT